VVVISSSSAAAAAVVVVVVVVITTTTIIKMVKNYVKYAVERLTIMCQIFTLHVRIGVCFFSNKRTNAEY